MEGCEAAALHAILQLARAGVTTRLIDWYSITLGRRGRGQSDKMHAANRGVTVQKDVLYYSKTRQSLIDHGRSDY